MILREKDSGFTDLELIPEEQREDELTEKPWETEWEFWRLYNFIENSVCFQTAEGNAEVLRMSGKAFGKFNRQLQDFDANQLVESIPHFHDTAFRMNTRPSGCYRFGHLHARPCLLRLRRYHTLCSLHG